MNHLSVYLGYDSRQAQAYRVAEHSLRRRCSVPVAVHRLDSADLYQQRLLWRPVERHEGQMRDHLSDAPMSTEFAVSRFLVPMLHGDGWALFADSDVVFLDDVAKLFALADPKYAVMVVKHDNGHHAGTKMDGQVQTVYSRKNWSSLAIFNCNHRANRVMLDVRTVNAARGLWLHNFGWLCDDEIGALPAEWNWLCGVQPKPAEPRLAHLTLGGPWLPDWRGAEHDEIWINEAMNMEAAA